MFSFLELRDAAIHITQPLKPKPCAEEAWPSTEVGRRKQHRIEEEPNADAKWENRRAMPQQEENKGNLDNEKGFESVSVKIYLYPEEKERPSIVAVQSSNW
jgi:hypothetical protein